MADVSASAVKEDSKTSPTETKVSNAVSVSKKNEPFSFQKWYQQFNFLQWIQKPQTWKWFSGFSFAAVCFALAFGINLWIAISLGVFAVAELVTFAFSSIDVIWNDESLSKGEKARKIIFKFLTALLAGVLAVFAALIHAGVNMGSFLGTAVGPGALSHSFIAIGFTFILALEAANAFIDLYNSKYRIGRTFQEKGIDFLLLVGITIALAFGLIQGSFLGFLVAGGLGTVFFAWTIINDTFHPVGGLSGEDANKADELEAYVARMAKLGLDTVKGFLMTFHNINDWKNFLAVPEEKEFKTEAAHIDYLKLLDYRQGLESVIREHFPNEAKKNAFIQLLQDPVGNRDAIYRSLIVEGHFDYSQSREVINRLFPLPEDVKNQYGTVGKVLNKFPKIDEWSNILSDQSDLNRFHDSQLLYSTLKTLFPHQYHFDNFVELLKNSKENRERLYESLLLYSQPTDGSNLSKEALYKLFPEKNPQQEVKQKEVKLQHASSAEQAERYYRIDEEKKNEAALEDARKRLNGTPFDRWGQPDPTFLSAAKLVFPPDQNGHNQDFENIRISAKGYNVLKQDEYDSLLSNLNDHKLNGETILAEVKEHLEKEKAAVNEKKEAAPTTEAKAASAPQVVAAVAADGKDEKKLSDVEKVTFPLNQWTTESAILCDKNRPTEFYQTAVRVFGQAAVEGICNIIQTRGFPATDLTDEDRSGLKDLMHGHGISDEVIEENIFPRRPSPNAAPRA